MLDVVCRILRPNMLHILILILKLLSKAVYGKLQNLETKTSREFLRLSRNESAQIITKMKGSNKPILSGYRTKFLDGNCIEATQHRISVLRDTKAGAYKSKSLVIFEPSLGIAIDVILCEDGHAGERALLQQVLETVVPNDLVVADRNFCVLSFLFGISKKPAYTAHRQHKNMPFKSLSAIEFIGNTDDLKVYEEKVSLTHDGEEIEARRIIVKLNQPLLYSEMEIAIFSNLPREDADAIKIADIYRLRLSIETAFQKLEKYLNSEINTLGYPKAALFCFCIALVAFNLYASKWLQYELHILITI